MSLRKFCWFFYFSKTVVLHVKHVLVYMYMES